jgi:hypothetical protein
METHGLCGEQLVAWHPRACGNRGLQDHGCSVKSARSCALQIWCFTPRAIATVGSRSSYILHAVPVLAFNCRTELGLCLRAARHPSPLQASGYLTLFSLISQVERVAAVRCSPLDSRSLECCSAPIVLMLQCIRMSTPRTQLHASKGSSQSHQPSAAALSAMLLEWRYENILILQHITDPSAVAQHG